jgi:hypothetical protein
MLIGFPDSKTVRTETLAHKGFHKLLLTRVSRSIDGFLSTHRLQLENYTLERTGDNLYISSVDGDNIDRLAPLKGDLLKHLNTNGFDLRDVFLEKKI